MAKYNRIKVRLTGEDGNPFAIISLVARALRQAKVSADEIAVFRHEAMAGDYQHVIKTCMEWVTVE